MQHCIADKQTNQTTNNHIQKHIVISFPSAFQDVPAVCVQALQAEGLENPALHCTRVAEHKVETPRKVACTSAQRSPCAGSPRGQWISWLCWGRWSSKLGEGSSLCAISVISSRHACCCCVSSQTSSPLRLGALALRSWNSLHHRCVFVGEIVWLIFNTQWWKFRYKHRLRWAWVRWHCGHWTVSPTVVCLSERLFDWFFNTQWWRF